MKTRNILLVMSLLLIAGNAVAQTRFYNVTRTFHESGFTYQADVDYGMVILYNRDAGRFVDPLVTPQTFRDGRGIPRDVRRRNPDLERATSRPMQDLAEQIVRNSLSAAERSRLGHIPGESLGLNLIICSDTGRVKEVHFDFHYDDGFGTIPVTTFRRMEVAIKEQVRFTPTDFGRSLNFIFRGWNIEFTR